MKIIRAEVARYESKKEDAFASSFSTVAYFSMATWPR
jgi:hypothetical protein